MASQEVHSVGADIVNNRKRVTPWYFYFLLNRKRLSHSVQQSNRRVDWPRRQLNRRVSCPGRDNDPRIVSSTFGGMKELLPSDSGALPSTKATSVTPPELPG
jgi:hypothetical protein